MAEQLEGEAAEDDAHGDEWGKRVGQLRVELVLVGLAEEQDVPLRLLLGDEH